MSALEDLKKVVKEAVAGNKLSASRVEATKKASARCFDRAHMVKPELLKIHTSASASSKICSLYLFDAMVRNARDVIKKNGAGYDAAKILPSVAKSADSTTAFVSAAKEFLSEMETIVIDIAVDTAKAVKPELREKVEKVVDIWRKAATFDIKVQEQLEAAVKSACASTSANGSATHRNGLVASKGTGTNGRSTTPPLSPPMDLKQRYGRAVAAGAPWTMPSTTPTAPPGLPANLAALFGGRGASSAEVDPSKAGSGEANANTGTQDFMKSLSSLLGHGGSGASVNTGEKFAAPAPPSTAAPAFDISQLSALQQFAGKSNTNSSPAPAELSSNSSQAHPPPPPPPPQGKSEPPSTAPLPPGLPPPPPAQTQPPAPSQTNASTAGDATAWPPQIDESAGDLSTFNIYTFNPTVPNQWPVLAQQWYNTNGYMPSLPEIGMNYLIFYQAALMSSMQAAMGNGNGGGGGAGDGGEFMSEGQQQQQGNDFGGGYGDQNAAFGGAGPMRLH